MDATPVEGAGNHPVTPAMLDCQTCGLRFAADGASPIDCPACGSPPSAPESAATEVIDECPETHVSVSAATEVASGPPSLEWASNRYADVEELARGGMGAILRAKDLVLERPVAIKVLLQSVREGSPQEIRFLREARVTGQLQHPNIPPIYDIGRSPQRLPYFAMKLIEGRSLAEILAQSTAGDDRRPLLAALVKVCDALAYAHDRGVVHRDLKPANVMIGEFGEVLVMDWGIAAVGGDAGPSGEGPDGAPGRVDPRLTAPGSVMGTPVYMPPEQARGEIEKIDPRTDVYSLGAMLYEVLTGAPPFGGGSVREVLDQVLRGRIEPPSLVAPDARIPPELDAIVQTAMASRRRGRYQRIEVLRDDLQAHLEGRPVSVARYSPLERVARWIRRHRTASIGIACAVLALAIGIATTIAGQRVATRERVATLLDEARVEMEEDDPAAAQDSLTRVLALDPGNEQAIEQLGPAAAGAEEKRRAARRRQEAVDLRQRLEREAERVRGLDPPIPTTRGDWYAAHAGLIEVARDLLGLVRDETASEILVWAALAAGEIAMEAGDWELANLMIEEACRVLPAERQRAERGRLDEARNLQRNQDEKVVAETIRALAAGPPKEGMLEEHTIRLASRPRPHVIRLLIPELFSDRTWVRRVAADALGRIGDRTTKATVDLADLAARVPPSAAPSGSLEGLRSLYLELRSRWSAGTERISLDPVQALVLRLLPLALDTDLEEAVEIAWALGRLKDSRAHRPLLAKYYAAGTSSLYVQRTAAPMEWVPHPEESRPADGSEDPDDHVHLERGNALSLSGDLDGAIAEYDEEIRRFPGNAVAHANRGAARHNKGDFDGAIADFGEAIRLAPEVPSYRDRRGVSRCESGDLEGAIADHSEAIRLDPNLAMPFFNRGRARSLASRLPGAISDCSRALELDEDFADALLLRGEARRGLGDLEGALDDLSGAIVLQPKRARAHHSRGDVKSDLGDDAGAIADYTEALRLDPSRASAYVARSRAHRWSGRMEEAIADASQAIEIDPRSAGAHQQRGQARFELGDHRGAIEDLGEAIRLDPDSPVPYCRRGDVRAALDDGAGAIEDYTQAIRCGPNYAEAYNKRGVAQQLLGDIDASIEDFTRAIECVPENREITVAALINRGNSHCAIGAPRAGLADLDRAIALDPSHWQAWGVRGFILARLGRRDEATRSFDRAAELCPPDRRAQVEANRLRAFGR